MVQTFQVALDFKKFGANHDIGFISDRPFVESLALN